MIIATGVAFYWNYIGKILVEDVKNHVAVASEEALSDINRILQTDKQTLEIIAVTVEDLYPWNYKEVLKDFLIRQNVENAFELVGVATLDGGVVVSDESRIFPMSFLESVKTKAIRDGFVLERLSNSSSGNNKMLQAVPLMFDKKPVGVLFAVLPFEHYKPLLLLSSSKDSGYSIIADGLGNVVMSGEKVAFNNIFDSLAQQILYEQITPSELVQTIKSKKEELFSYRVNNKRHFLHLAPLNWGNWMLISSLTTSYVEEQTHHLTWISLILFLFIFVIFCILIAYMFRIRAISNRQLFTTAFKDPLTGADNFNRMCEVFSEKLKGLNNAAVLVIFDIMQFKVINDLHGYEQGNKVLEKVANVLGTQIDVNEFFCRSTADNFILLLSFTEKQKLLARLKSIGTLIRRNCTVMDSCIMVDAAFGVYQITEDIPFYIMLDRAHLALDNAKKSADNKIQFYVEQDLRKVVEERQIENSMEEALLQDEFSVYLQPKCDLKTSEVVGAEALVRWNKPQKGIIRPDEFIPIFEKNGFILKLDMVILEKVVRQLAQWKQAGLHRVPIAVNFSRLHLKDSAFLQQIVRIVDKYEIPHRLIEVEITENVILNNIEPAQRFIFGLHQHGFSVAMDDFGSGFSSLNVLKNLHFDSIKMDKEFLHGFEQNPRARQVIEGAVHMIKSLGAKIVAEGVETNEQADFLNDLQCEIAQGYKFYKPLTIADFEKLLPPRQS